MLTLKFLTIQGVDWYPSLYFGDLDHVNLSSMTNDKCSIRRSKHSYIVQYPNKIISKLFRFFFQITLHPLFTFLTILELIFQFRNRNYEKIWTFYEERTPFSRSVSSVLSFFHSISFPQSKFKNSDQSHKTLINSVIMLGTPMKNSPYAR